MAQIATLPKTTVVASDADLLKLIRIMVNVKRKRERKNAA
jgi:hypothetical protein